jgi:hypothetical protein
MDSGDEPEEPVVRLFEGGFTGRRLPSVDLNQTASLRISLLD